MITQNMCFYKEVDKGNLKTMKLLDYVLTEVCVVFRFVCVEVLRPSQPNGVLSSAISLPNRTFTGQA